MRWYNKWLDVCHGRWLQKIRKGSRLTTGQGSVILRRRRYSMKLVQEEENSLKSYRLTIYGLMVLQCFDGT